MEKENIFFNVPNLYVNLIRLDLNPDKVIRGSHFHKEIEIVRVDEGNIFCFLKDRKISVNKGEILFINSGVVHNLICNSTNAKITYIQIDMTEYIKKNLPSDCLGFYLTVGSLDLAGFKIFSNASEMCQLISQIEREIENKKTGFKISLNGYIAVLLAYMSRNDLFYNLDSLQRNKNIIRILPIVDYIEKNFKSKIYLEDLSRVLNINKYTICKEFKRTVGYSFTDYLNLRRLENAVDLLINTDKSICEIAFESGFASVQYFNKSFKSAKSVTPKEYRKMCDIGV